MKTYHGKVLVDGLAFPEAPRWHQGCFWFTDQHAQQVFRIDASGTLHSVLETADKPGGLGWLPDGSLLVVYMTRRQIMRWDGRHLTLYADLSGHASFHCNDMVVDQQGRIYVGNFGFDLHAGAAQSTAELILVDTDRQIEVLSSDILFPNGSVITTDNQLIVAETFAHRLTLFELNAAGRITASNLWADLQAMTPDGICLDQEGHIWVASPGTRQVIRVKQGGAMIEACTTTGTPYACMLGGDDRTTLYICTSESDDPQLAARLRSGRIETAQVSVAGAGLP